jgi:hypothetical protein
MRNFSLSEIIGLLKTDPIDLSIETNRRRLRHYLERLVQYEKFAQACNDARAHLPHDPSWVLKGVYERKEVISRS